MQQVGLLIPLMVPEVAGQHVAYTFPHNPPGVGRGNILQPHGKTLLVHMQGLSEVLLV